jgi:hypothetical protein
MFEGVSARADKPPFCFEPVPHSGDGPAGREKRVFYLADKMQNLRPTPEKEGSVPKTGAGRQHA